MQTSSMAYQTQRPGKAGTSASGATLHVRHVIARSFRSGVAGSAALTFLCFLLTSTGWLAWAYHVPTQVPEGMADIVSLTFGYLLQAAGIGAYALASRRRTALTVRTLPTAAIVAFSAFMVPAVLSPYAAGMLAFGFLMNFACGIIAGHYLYDLAANVPARRRASAFGCGYGLAAVASWLLSNVDGGSIYYSSQILFVCLFLAATAIAVTWTRPTPGHNLAVSTKETQGSAKAGGTKESREQSVLIMPDRRLIATACGLVFVFGIVNSCGFAFPQADLGGPVRIEHSRLLYALGLLVAGFVADHSRRAGAICALTALAIPFIILSLHGETIPVTVFWSLSYLAFGFYSVFRVLLFLDLAADYSCLFIAGFGLLFGRVGEAAGEAIFLAMASNLVALVCVTAALFALSIFIFFKVYQLLYAPEAARELGERERFHRFSASHDLTEREQDMLRMLLDRKTNTQIATELTISENTVKYHVRNLLQKTGCKNRTDLVSAYWTYPENGGTT